MQRWWLGIQRRRHVQLEALIRESCSSQSVEGDRIDNEERRFIRSRSERGADAAPWQWVSSGVHDNYLDYEYATFGLMASPDSNERTRLRKRKCVRNVDRERT